MPESCLGSKGMLEKFYFSKKFLFVFLLMLRFLILSRFKSNAREIFYKILFVFLLMLRFLILSRFKSNAREILFFQEVSLCIPFDAQTFHFVAFQK